MAQQQRDETAQQHREETARHDYVELRSRDDEGVQAGPWSRALEEAARVSLELPIEALRAWQGITRANMHLVAETMRASLSLFGLQRRS